MMDGHIMFSVNLDGGIVMSKVTVVSVDDGQFHDVQFTRKGRTMELLLDGMYLTRGVAPGNNDLFDISSNDIFLGSDSSLRSGFVGCMYGVRIDNKDLPLSDTNEYFIATPSQGGVIQSCATNSTTTILEVFNSLYVLVGAVLGLIVIFTVIYVLLTKSTHYCYVKRKGKFSLQSQTRDPIFSPVNPIAITRRSLRQTLSSSGITPQSYLQQTNSFEHLEMSIDVYSTNRQTSPRPTRNQSLTPSPVKLVMASEHSTSHTRDTSPQHITTSFSTGSDRPSPGRYDRLSTVPANTRGSSPIPVDTHSLSPIPVDTHRPSPTPVSIPELPVSEKKQQTPSPELTKLQMMPPPLLDPMTGMPLCVCETDQDEPDHSISTTGGDVKSYIMDKVKNVNKGLLAQNYDELHVFCDEGPYFPLGSIGSLYDILNEEEMEEEEEFRIIKMEAHPKAGSKSYKQNTPSPLLASYSHSPDKHKRHDQGGEGGTAKVHPKVLRKAIPSSKKKHINTEKLLAMSQLRDSTNSQWLNAKQDQIPPQLKSEFL